MHKLISYIKDYKKEAILGALFKLFEAILELMVPLVMVKIIDVGVVNKDFNYILRMGGILVLLGSVGLASALVCQYLASRASQGFGTKLRNQLFSHINSLSHSEIDKIGTPSLITRITNDVNQLQVSFAMLIRLATRVPFIIIGSAIMAMFIDLKLSIIFFISTPLISLVLYLVMKYSIPFYSSIQKKLDFLALITRENLEGARVIRAFSKEESEKKRFYNGSDTLSKEAINVGRFSALLTPITFVIMNFSIVAIIWFGGLSINIGSLSQGQIIAFVNYLTQILLALVVLANLIIQFNKAFASAIRVSEVLNLESTVVETATSIPQEIQGFPKIDFRNISFSYENSKETALKNVSISIAEGETLGIIGGTGSGKSTLINLIPRFYDVTKGEILIDGINIKDYPLKNLRTQIGLVPQKAVLFSGTIRENMCLGLETSTDSEIGWALDIAQASEFVDNLSEGYNTKISQGGKNLSGGQKQRLTIARALVSKPQILILDDSSSALDFATDAKLRKAIKEKTKGISILIISQRASTIKGADKILVLDGGGVAGIGTHDELLLNCDLYKEICLSQLDPEEVNR